MARVATSQMETGRYDSLKYVAKQTIRTYSDLLLHQMGEDLADNHPDRQFDNWVSSQHEKSYERKQHDYLFCIDRKKITELD